MHQKLPSSRRCPKALVIILGLAAAGIPMQARADTLTYRHVSVPIPTGLAPSTAYEFLFGDFNDSNKSAPASDFTVTPNPFPAASAVSVFMTTPLERASGYPDFTLSAYFTIAQLHAISTLTGTIVNSLGDTVNISQPVVFGSGLLVPIDLRPRPLVGLRGLLLSIGIGSAPFLSVTITDPSGLIHVELLPVVHGQITLPLTASLPGIYTVNYSIGGQDFVAQRNVAVPEPGMFWVFGPGLLAIMMAGLRRQAAPARAVV